MKTEGLRPPRMAEWLLERAAGPIDAEQLAGDLSEEFSTTIVPSRGVPRARRWYWRQVVRSALPLILGRARAGLESGLAGGFGSVLRQDLRYAFRSLRRSPGFALVVILTLGLGIGSSTVVFSVVDGVVLNPFPFPDGDRLVGVGNEFPRINQQLRFEETMSPAEFLDVRDGSQTLEDVVAWSYGNREMIGLDGTPDRVFTAFWFGDAFQTLRLEPVIGRGFTEQELSQGTPVAVISHRLWQLHFGSDPALVGRTVDINGSPFTLVGVMPPRMLLGNSDLWLPWQDRPESFDRDLRTFQVLARLKDGVSLTAANTELEGLARRTEQAFGAEFEAYADWRLEARSWTYVHVRGIKPAALTLLSAMVFVLLLVCANVSSLLLARSTGRRREIALRSSLGAGRLRVLRQLLTESVVLSVLGGLAGFGLALLGTVAVEGVLADLPASLPGEVRLNTRVLLFVSAVSVASGVVIGLVPAMHLTGTDLQGMLRTEGGGSTGGGRRHRLQHMFVGLEVALALALLAGGGLLMRSFVELQARDPGFVPTNVLTMRLSLPQERYARADVQPFYATLLERVRGLPGVREASFGEQFPPSLWSRGQFSVEGTAAYAQNVLPAAYVSRVWPRYQETLGLTLLQGRLLADGDVADARRVAVVNETTVRRYLGSDPLGRRVKLGAVESEAPWFEVVGIVADAHNRGLDRDPEPEIWLSLEQAAYFNRQLFLLVRTELDPVGLLEPVRQQIRALDPNQPTYLVQTLEEAYERSYVTRSVSAGMLSLFAAFALVLAALGIYAVVGYAVAERTREIGVRIALGARGDEVRLLMVRQALTPVLLGAAAGLALALLLGRLLASQLFQISSADPATLIAVTLLLVGVAAAASYLPARRASRLDPLVALRHE